MMQSIRRRYRIKQIILVFIDLLSYSGAFFLAFFLRQGSFPNEATIEAHWLLFAIVFPLWIILNYINAQYHLSGFTERKTSIIRYGETALFALLSGIIFFYLLPLPEITPKRILLFTVIFGYGIAFLFRQAALSIFGIAQLKHRILFIGYSKEVKELLDLIKEYPHRGYSSVALIDDRIDKETIQAYPNLAFYQSLKTIRPAISTNTIDLVIISPEMQQNDEAVRELYQLLFWPVQLMELSNFYALLTGRIPPFTFSDTWFLRHLRHTQHPIYEKWRTFMDYVSAVILGSIFLCLFPAIALAIKLTSPGPILLKQKRVGKGGKTFFLYKFRSMYALAKDGSAEVAGYQFAKKNDSRITPIGKFLRKTRLDELPQVINLFRREITLIGPRPERPVIVEELTGHMPYYPLRHVVRPGLTGWAVIHQNYIDSIEMSLQKLQYDLYYIKHRSFLLDISILLKTVNLIVRGSGQ